MYLIKVKLDRGAPEVKNALSDCEKMHVLVSSLFASDRASANIQFRLNISNNQPILYIYSDLPVTGCSYEKYDVKQRNVDSWVNSLNDEKEMSFDILLSPSKKQYVDGHRNSRRVIIRNVDERLEWVNNIANRSGFCIKQILELEQVHQSGRHRDEFGGKMYLDAFHYQGMLKITDGKLFQICVKKGFGSGKAYGFGMLLLK